MTYRGESSRSSRQRHKEHLADLGNGVAASPLVAHAVEAHGGRTPTYLFTIGTVEPRPLHRAVRESVEIAMLPQGIENMNRCQEWGAPRVPILTASGGDKPARNIPAGLNDRPGWTKTTMDDIKEGRLKRVRLIPMIAEPAKGETETEGDNGDNGNIGNIEDKEPGSGRRLVKRRRRLSPVRETAGTGGEGENPNPDPVDLPVQVNGDGGDNTHVAANVDRVRTDAGAGAGAGQRQRQRQTQPRITSFTFAAMDVRVKNRAREEQKQRQRLQEEQENMLLPGLRSPSSSRPTTSSQDNASGRTRPRPRSDSMPTTHPPPPSEFKSTFQPRQSRPPYNIRPMSPLSPWLLRAAKVREQPQQPQHHVHDPGLDQTALQQGEEKLRPSSVASVGAGDQALGTCPRIEDVLILSETELKMESLQARGDCDRYHAS